MKFCGIEMNPDNYDDEVAVAAYAMKNYPDLMTALDRRVCDYIAPILSTSNDFKLRRLYACLEDRDGHINDAEVIAAFAVPIEERRMNAGRRLIESCRSDLAVARCIDCNRVLRTPRAQQCLWCGADWHPDG